MTNDPSDKISAQIKGAGLPTSGELPFQPMLDRNRRGELIIRKACVEHGPKQGKRGYVDVLGRIWVKDYAHGTYPTHWDVQENGGRLGHTRVDLNGSVLP